MRGFVLITGVVVLSASFQILNHTITNKCWMVLYRVRQPNLTVLQ